jgi:hypothetical protein
VTKPNQIAQAFAARPFEKPVKRKKGMTLTEMKNMVVKEAKHFWLGSKLLYVESRASSQLLKQAHTHAHTHAHLNRHKHTEAHA